MSTSATKRERFDTDHDFLVLTQVAANQYRELTGQPHCPEPEVRAHVVGLLATAHLIGEQPTPRGLQRTFRATVQNRDGVLDLVAVWGVKDGVTQKARDGRKQAVFLTRIRLVSGQPRKRVNV